MTCLLSVAHFILGSVWSESVSFQWFSITYLQMNDIPILVSTTLFCLPYLHVTNSQLLWYCRLGLEHIYQLTTHGSHILRVTLEDWDGTTRYAEYSQFHLEDEQDKYRLRYDNFLSGLAGDGLGYNRWGPARNQPFSTPENDNDQAGRNCAADFQSGWWFKKCFNANLNGPYQTSPNDGRWQGIQWYTWKLKVSVRLRPKRKWRK